MEQYGAGEAYLPVLEAWTRLARDAGGGVAGGPAPPARADVAGAASPLCSIPSEHGALRNRAQGATRERMLREMAELLEAVTAERPMILVLEDLHWSDHSTLELIAYVAQRRAPAHLLLDRHLPARRGQARRLPAARDRRRSCRRAAAARRSC